MRNEPRVVCRQPLHGADIKIGESNYVPSEARSVLEIMVVGVDATGCKESIGKCLGNPHHWLKQNLNAFLQTQFHPLVAKEDALMVQVMEPKEWTFVSGFFGAAPLTPPQTAAEEAEAMGTPSERASLAFRQPHASAEDRMGDLHRKMQRFLGKSIAELEETGPSEAKYKIHSAPSAEVDYTSGYQVAALMMASIRRLICFYSSLGYT